MFCLDRKNEGGRGVVGFLPSVSDQSWASTLLSKGKKFFEHGSKFFGGVPDPSGYAHVVILRSRFKSLRT